MSAGLELPASLPIVLSVSHSGANIMLLPEHTRTRVIPRTETKVNICGQSDRPFK